MDEQALRAAIRRLMLSNVKDGYSGLLGQHYCYIAPALKPYPFQWFWDTCFHVMILARLGEHDLAKRNLRSLFAMQDENGFVGHMIFWKQLLPQRRTDVMQARPTGQALLAKNRDFDGDGLLSIISPFESGMDWKASYDAVLGYAQRTTPRRLYTSKLYWKAVGIDLTNFLLRYELQRIKQRGKFRVKDAGFNAIYAVDLDCMEKLAVLVGDDPKPFAERRRRLVSSMMRLMYDEQSAAFYDVREPGSHKLRVLTPTIFFPLAIQDLDPAIAAQVLDAHFEKEGEFGAPLPIPSVQMGTRRSSAARRPSSGAVRRGPPSTGFSTMRSKSAGLTSAQSVCAARCSLWSRRAASGSITTLSAEKATAPANSLGPVFSSTCTEEDAR